MNGGYERYMASEAWANKRKAVLRRAGGRCEVCRRRDAKHVHHKSYANLGDEPLSDLLAVCVPCHQKKHPNVPMTEFVPVVEIQCPMCPNDMVEVFWEKRTCRTFCPSCGHTTTKHYPKKRKRVPKKPTKPTKPTLEELEFERRERERERVMRINRGLS